MPLDSPRLALGAYLFAATLLLTLALTPLAVRLGRRWNVLDLPDPRKIHKSPIPLSGGWALFAALSLALWGHLAAAGLFRDSLGAWVHPAYLDRLPELPLKLLPVYAGAAATFLLGLADDLRGLSVKARLAAQAAIAIGLVALGLRPNLDVLPSWVGATLGVLWIVGITNAFNFLDGLDGLSTGVSLVATTALLCVMAQGEQPNVAFFLAALAGAQLGFLRWNAHPAKVFLGSSGSLLLGYLMGVSTIAATYMTGNPDNRLLPVLVPLFILAVPIYDTASVVLIRLLKRRSVAIGDQSHFHHRLMSVGFSHRQTVVFIWLVALAVALSAVRLIGATLGQSLLVLAQIFAVLCLIVLAERVANNVRLKLLERRQAERKDEALSESDPAPR